jgi:restriction endonuclease/NACHT domain-containing protein
VRRKGSADKRDKTNPEYLEFEARAAFMYEALGFRVTRNANTSGQQIDLLATRFVAGVGTVRIMVECKWRKGGAISNQDVQTFYHTVSLHKGKQEITRGVMVSNVQFSQDAFLTAKGLEDIELVTIENLENQLLDVRQVLESFSDNHESSLIFLHYIRLRAKWSSRWSSGSSDDIEEVITDWLDEKDVKLVSVLGDYGGGKTTLVERLKYVYAQRYLAGVSTLIPIIIPLNRFHQYTTLDEFLRNVIISELEREMPVSVFWRTLRSGRFIILLDGFDEMSTRSDKEARRENLSKLLPLFHVKSRAILTCRPAHFLSDAEYRTLISAVNEGRVPLSLNPKDNYQTASSAAHLRQYALASVKNATPISRLPPQSIRTVELASFGEDQIDLYLRQFDVDYRQRFGSSWIDVKSFLLSIYDLKDLMTRPILLAMINSTVLEGKIGPDSEASKLGPSMLYEIYTKSKLEHDWGKGETRHLIGTEVRFSLAQAIAITMLEHEAREITFSELLNLAQRHSSFPLGEATLNEIRPAILASDIQVSTFLIRSGDEIFSFSHQSFMEFFVAFYLKECVKNNNYAESIFESYLTKEILYFLGSYAIPEQVIRKVLIEWNRLGRKVGFFGRNVVAALLYTARSQPALRIEEVELSSIDFNGISFTKPVWDNVKISNSRWEEISMTVPNLQTVTVEDSNLGQWTIIKGGMDADIIRSKIELFECTGAIISFRSRSCEMKNSRFYGGLITLSGETALINGNFSESRLNLRSPVGSGISFVDCVFTETSIVFQQGKDLIRFRGCSFMGCFLFALRMSMHDYRNLDLRDSEGLIIITDPEIGFSIGFFVDPKRGFVVTTESIFDNKTAMDEISSIFGREWREMLLSR